MTLDKVSSERLSSLRFPLIAGVVFIHAYNTELDFSNGVVGVADTSYLVDFIRNLVSNGIARLAVPLFFLMSGYFLFLGFSWSKENYIAKIKSRINTLLIPFLFWNIFVLALLALAQLIPATQPFFSAKKAQICTFGAYDYLNAIFGIDKPPIAYQFWFIRDLIVLVVFSPAIYFAIKKSATPFLLAVFALWFFDIRLTYIPCPAALIFFSAGAYFALANISLFSLDRFGLLFLFSYCVTLLIDAATKGYLINPYIHDIGILLGLASTLYLTKTLIKRDKARETLLWASGCSFFVFAVHEPLLTVLRKVGYKLIAPSNDVVILLLYFLIPTLVILLSVLLYTCLKAIAPKFLSAISGSR
jgi:surface polysaccharide O-acyltransferase-like enzyme